MSKEEHSMNPKISIIIPTANRPHYLPRAIDSALSGMVVGDVEVIVVPNGPDDSWHDALLPYHDNRMVRVFPITTANANIARNTGLTEAKGEFVRFLDDDDYLIPEGVIKQYALIQSSKVDIVSGNIESIDERGQCFNILRQPKTNDLCVAVLSPARVCQPTAHLYRRSVLLKSRWNPETPVRQDLDWLLDLCTSMELCWKKTDAVVGVWQHHWEQRISSSTQFNEIRKITVPMLMKAYEHLQIERRLNKDRRQAVAQGLWGCVHSAFFLEPRYWSKVAQTAQKIDPTTRPFQAIYAFPVIHQLNPLFIQWLLLPKRWCSWIYRRLQKQFHIKYHC